MATLKSVWEEEVLKYLMLSNINVMNYDGNASISLAII